MYIPTYLNLFTAGSEFSILFCPCFVILFTWRSKRVCSNAFSFFANISEFGLLYVWDFVYCKKPNIPCVVSHFLFIAFWKFCFVREAG